MASLIYTKFYMEYAAEFKFRNFQVLQAQNGQYRSTFDVYGISSSLDDTDGYTKCTFRLTMG
jgi:hypothetical protein